MNTTRQYDMSFLQSVKDFFSSFFDKRKKKSGRKRHKHHTHSRKSCVNGKRATDNKSSAADASRTADRNAQQDILDDLDDRYFLSSYFDDSKGGDDLSNFSISQGDGFDYAQQDFDDDLDDRYFDDEF